MQNDYLWLKQAQERSDKPPFSFVIMIMIICDNDYEGGGIFHTWLLYPNGVILAGNLQQGS